MREQTSVGLEELSVNRHVSLRHSCIMSGGFVLHRGAIMVRISFGGLKRERGSIHMMIEDIDTAAGKPTSYAKTANKTPLLILAWAFFLAVGLSLAGASAYADDANASDVTSANSDVVLQAGVQSDSAARAKRTIMLYICGADLEEDAGMASINLRQVLNADFGDGEDVRFIVMTGGSYRWDLEKEYLVFPDGVNVPDDAVQKGNPLFDEEVVLGDPKSQISGPYNQIWEAKSMGAADNPGKLMLLDGDGLNNCRADTEGSEEWMSDPATLKSFIDYSVENFPAEKYDLILWDHGGGPTGGFAIDNRRQQLLFGSNTMSFAQIIEALKDNKVTDGDGDGMQDGTFDFVNFDACLMGSTEITLAIADYVDYYIASPEIVPGRGQLYKGWLDELGKNPDASTYDLGKRLVDDFVAYYDAGYEDGTRQEGTMALIDTKKLFDAGFVGALSTIGEAMKSQVESGLFYDELRSVKSSIKYEGDQFYDLGNLVSHLGVSFWELDPDAVADSAIDYTNDAYTEAAKTVLDILSNPDIVYAGDTAGMHKGSNFFMGADGKMGSGMIESSGLHLYFPLTNYDMAVPNYDDEIQDVIAFMPEDDRVAFLENYVQTLYEYYLIQMSGRAVTGMVNACDEDGKKLYDRNAIDYDALVQYWNLPLYPGAEGLELYTYYRFRVVPLYKAMDADGDAGAAEAATAKWLDGVVKQQALEAVSTDNVTAQSFVTKNGVGSKIQIANTRRRSVENVRMDVVAELPAVRNYIVEHDKDIDDPDYALYALIEKGVADLPLGSVKAAMDASSETIEDSTGDFLRDYVAWFNAATTTGWDVNPLPQSWYAIKDAGGTLHVAFNDNDSLSYAVPMIRLRNGQIGDNPELNLLGFDDGKLTRIYLRDDEGNARIIKASDLQVDMELIPALYIDSGLSSTILPASLSSVTVSPNNIDSIELVYTDMSNIGDIQDVDGDGDAVNYKYAVSDIYGASVDISQKVNNPEGSLIDIRLAKVEPATYTGEELVPTLTYDGRTLVEGVDYFWEKDNDDEAFVLPGEYGITVYGYGDFVDMLIGTFVIEPAGEGSVPLFERLSGDVALDTMVAIVREGWAGQTGGTIVLATQEGYWDALTAAGIAGMAKAPVLMTDAKALSWQTAALLGELRPATIVVCGGEAALAESVARAAAAAAGGARIVRCKGDTATGTAVDVFSKAKSEGFGTWSTTAFVCTNQGYWDALAAAPVSYAKAMPIFLTENEKDISDETLEAMKGGGIEQVYIVGGEKAIEKSVQSKIEKSGIKVADRLAGETCVETSEAVAQFAFDQGMGCARMGVATANGHWDALAGAPLCGVNESILVLAWDSTSDSVNAFVDAHRAEVEQGYVFGGEFAIDRPTFDILNKSA